jgi:hypothetical protein
VAQSALEELPAALAEAILPFLFLAILAKEEGGTLAKSIHHAGTTVATNHVTAGIFFIASMRGWVAEGLANSVHPNHITQAADVLLGTLLFGRNYLIQNYVLLGTLLCKIRNSKLFDSKFKVLIQYLLLRWRNVNSKFTFQVL